MAKVYAPNKDYNGVSAGVVFVNGVGETSDPYLLNWFKEKGYKVEEQKPKKSSEENRKDNGHDKSEVNENKNK